MAQFCRDLASGIVKAFVAVDKELVVGYAMYYDAYCTWGGRYIFLEDLYVAEAYRKQRVGYRLLQKVVQASIFKPLRSDKSPQEAVSRQMKTVRWEALASNAEGLAFYARLGAHNRTNEESWQQFELKEEQLKEIAHLASE